MGVLLYSPIKERLLLDRTLVIIGLTFTSIITVLLGLAPKEPTPEVAKITFIDVTPFLILPPSTTSTTSTLPEVIPAGISTDHKQRCPKWEAKFREYGLPVQAFSYIAYRESRCNPKAWNRTLNANGSQDLGLVQVNSSWKTVTHDICGTGIKGLFDVDCNLSVAKYLYDNGGLGHWNL